MAKSEKDTIFMQNIMILSQAVLHKQFSRYFVNNVVLLYNMAKSEKDTIFMQNIMILSQAVLQIFCLQGPLYSLNA